MFSFKVKGQQQSMLIIRAYTGLWIPENDEDENYSCCCDLCTKLLFTEFVMELIAGPLTDQNIVLPMLFGISFSPLYSSHQHANYTVTSKNINYPSSKYEIQKITKFMI